MTQQPPTYRTTLKRYNELERAAKLGLTAEERDEMDALAAILDEHETAYALRQAGSAGVVWNTVL